MHEQGQCRYSTIFPAAPCKPANVQIEIVFCLFWAPYQEIKEFYNLVEYNRERERERVEYNMTSSNIT